MQPSGTSQDAFGGVPSELVTLEFVCKCLGAVCSKNFSFSFWPSFGSPFGRQVGENAKSHGATPAAAAFSLNPPSGHVGPPAAISLKFDFG